MKLSKVENTVANRGIQDRYFYQVANSPKLMDMLGNMLYSDKILAPVRELTTNAIDAHVLAGSIDKPIKFKLPSNLEETPTFSIRDYGTGMSEERIIKMYRIYGISTKEDDDEQQGAFGIGSKSPFGYCDSFTTNSYYNGKKYVFINSKAVNGVPTLNKIGEFDTDEENGLEISFPVKNADINLFKQKLQFVLKRCPVPYECNVSLNINEDNKEIILQGDNWKVFYGSGGAKAIMGYIEYPIDQSHFYNDSDSYKLLGMPIELSFNIGEIEMDISREKLQYNEFTISAIKERLKEIKNSLYNMIKNEIDKADNLYEARILYEEFCGKFDWIIKNSTFLWNGEQIKTSYTICEEFRYDTDYSRCYYLERYYSRIKHKTFVNLYHIRFDKEVKIFINDLGKVNRNRLTGYLNNNSKINACVVFEKGLEKSVIEKLGIPQDQLIYVSTLPKPLPTIRTAASVKSYPAKLYNCTTQRLISSKINKSIGSQYFLVSQRNKIYLGTRTLTDRSFKDIINGLKQINMILPNDIYFVIPSKVETVEKWGWKRLDDIIIKDLKKSVNGLAKRKHCLAHMFSLYKSKMFGFFIEDSKIFSEIPNGLFKKYIKFLKYTKECSQDKYVKSIKFLSDELNINSEDDSKVKSKTIDILSAESRVYSKYPLIKIINEKYFWSDDYQAYKKHILDYVKMVDSN